MTSNSNEQDLVFKAIFEDEASDDMAGLGDEVDDLDKGMGSLSLSSVTAGLAMFGVGVGVNQVVGAVQESITRMGSLRAAMSLLPEATQDSLENMGPAFLQIADDMAATSLEVEEMAVAISRSAGGAVPSIENIEFAFALMKLEGLEAGAAADLVGQALQRNEDPLNTLLDPGGKSYISLIAAQEKYIAIAKDVVTPIDDTTRAFRDLGQKAGTWAGIIDILNGKEDPSFDPDPDQKGFTGFGNLIDIATEWIAKQQELRDDMEESEEGFEGLISVAGGWFDALLRLNEQPISFEQSQEAARTLREELDLLIADASVLAALGILNPENLTPQPVSVAGGVGGFRDLTQPVIIANITVNADTDVEGSVISRKIAEALANLTRTGVTN